MAYRCGMCVPKTSSLRKQCERKSGGIYLPCLYESEKRNKISRFSFVTIAVRMVLLSVLPKWCANPTQRAENGGWIRRGWILRFSVQRSHNPVPQVPDIFYFFSARGGGRGVRGLGGGGVDFYWKSQEEGGVLQEREGPRGRCLWRVGEFGGGGGG